MITSSNNEGSTLEYTALKWKRMLPKVVTTVLKWSKIFKEDLGLDIPEVVIDRAHRIGLFKEVPQSDKKVCSIIVRFTTWRHIIAVYSARKKTDKFRI